MTTQKTILAAEDCATTRQLIKLVLQTGGHTVYLAPDGKAAFEMFQALNPDLVVTDFNMPFVNGLELANQIRSEASLSNVPILMLSAETSSLLKEKAKNIPISGWMGKPFSATNLKKVVQLLLDRHDATEKAFDAKASTAPEPITSHPICQNEYDTIQHIQIELDALIDHIQHKNLEKQHLPSLRQIKSFFCQQTKKRPLVAQRCKKCSFPECQTTQKLLNLGLAIDMKKVMGGHQLQLQESFAQFTR
ncbi:MAG: response regulator [Magnetococcales bacterium]|nr:response regulator [Magnetococcales bacterium]